jgi:hypothetical protein
VVETSARAKKADSVALARKLMDVSPVEKFQRDEQ